MPPLVQNFTTRKWFKMTQFGYVLENFSRVLELKMGVLGLRFHLASKTMFI